MHCSNGLVLPPVPTSRFPVSTTPDPLNRLHTVRYPTRMNFGSAKINMKEEKLTFYEMLGISQSGSFPEIKQAYKQLALKYHPDVSPPDRVAENTEKFIKVQEAYETLSDPTRRACYDRDLANGVCLAFSNRRRHPYDQVMEDRSLWKKRWQEQLAGLERRSKQMEAKKSWASRMRQQGEESSEQ